MHNFFVNETARQGVNFFITGADFNHIKNVLRMKVGESFLVSLDNVSHLCELAEIREDIAVAHILTENYQNTNLPIKIYLFQGLPKSDKLELIIQKAVELGAECIIPTEMTNCVVKLDNKKKASKVARWQAIAESAAKQSKRSFIPTVHEVLSYKDALKMASELDLLLVPYECKNGMEATKEALKEIKSGMSVGIIIGAEGGFTENEIALAKENGGKIISLGKRILRAETAAITSVAMCMLYAEMNLE